MKKQPSAKEFILALGRVYLHEVANLADILKIEN